MKTTYKYLPIVACILAHLAITSCNKPDSINYDREGNIYMPMAANSNRKLALLLADTQQIVIFGAAYGGLKYPGQDVTVNFAIDSASVNSYNAQNGTSYRLLPSGSYTIPSFDAVIKAGTTNSDALPLKITTKNLDRTIKYILPVAIKKISSGYIDSALGTTYFTIDTIQRLEKDITSSATLAVSQDNSGGSGAGEGSKKLVDGDNNSKFLMSGYTSAFWAQLQFNSAQIVNSYTLTSGNDAPDRDAKDWQLVGSKDATTWTKLDIRVGETFSGRNQVRRFELNNSVPYNYYRLNITANGGSNLLQISEWRLITYP